MYTPFEFLTFLEAVFIEIVFNKCVQANFIWKLNLQTVPENLEVNQLTQEGQQASLRYPKRLVICDEK